MISTPIALQINKKVMFGVEGNEIIEILYRKVLVLHMIAKLTRAMQIKREGLVLHMSQTYCSHVDKNGRTCFPYEPN